MELDVQGAPAKPCQPEVRHARMHKHYQELPENTQYRAANYFFLVSLLRHPLFSPSRSVRGLSSFVQDTARGLSNKVSDGDYAGLVDIMGHLMAIRDRQISNEQHFKPLKSTAELLKTYGQQLPESVYEQLEVCSKNEYISTSAGRYVHFYHYITFSTIHRSCRRSGRV